MFQSNMTMGQRNFRPSASQQTVLDLGPLEHLGPKDASYFGHAHLAAWLQLEGPTFCRPTWTKPIQNH